jgi:hypothetical protein
MKRTAPARTVSYSTSIPVVRRASEGAAGGVPEPLMGRGERAVRAGGDPRGGPGQRAGLASEDLQVVVQGQVLGALVQRPVVGRDELAVGEGDDRPGAEPGGHPPADQPYRDRVVRLPHADPGLRVDPAGQRGRGVEVVVRQRVQRGPLDLEHGPDRLRAGLDPAGVVRRVGRRRHLVQRGQRPHVRDRGQVPAPEPADLALDPALLMRAVLARQAVERVI